MRYESACSNLGVRDAEMTAHAAFRRRLYDHDVVPDAKAAAAALAPRTKAVSTNHQLANPALPKRVCV
jgi:hypothetical protein